MHFNRKSEKPDHQIEQLELRLEELETDEDAVPVDIPKTPLTTVERPPRRPLPEHLPREIQTHLPESAAKCAQCGGLMSSLGECRQNNWSTCRTASWSSAMCARSLRARVATTAPIRPRRVATSELIYQGTRPLTKQIERFRAQPLLLPVQCSPVPLPRDPDLDIYLRQTSENRGSAQR